MGRSFGFRWVGSGANRHDWRDLSSAFVKTFITEYFVGLVVQASSYVFNGGAEPKLTDTVLISFGVIVCLFVSLLLRVVRGAAAFPSWGSDGRESPSRAVLRRPARPSRPRRLYSPRGPWIWPGIIRLVYPGSGHTASHAVFGALTGPESCLSRRSWHVFCRYLHGNLTNLKFLTLNGLAKSETVTRKTCMLQFL